MWRGCSRGASDNAAANVFFGGGTPSLLPASVVAQILRVIDEYIGIAGDAEVTLEANPGASEHGAWGDYVMAGVNRLSLGVQSLDDYLLNRLGRIHDAHTAIQSLRAARAGGLAKINADLMYALPGQTPASAQADVLRIMDLGVEHISHYQLTIEEGTPMASNLPPDLPDEQSVLAMENACRTELAAGGFERYEISAFARFGQRCAHNLNYWRYGDYLGVGPGAHGKITGSAGSIARSVAVASPRQWLDFSGTDQAVAEQWVLSREEVVFELFANGLRLREGILPGEAQINTGLPWAELERHVKHLLESGWLEWQGGRLCATAEAFEMLDTALESILPAS